ncbi:MAG: prolipoprotein diacylglyceryl transferase [Alphaproteobacteria bacterium]|nr:prolipoprotein diacylglyceryl transferase [Alphaproteobacteria bacterium]
MLEATLTYPNIDPVFIHLGPLAVRWYAISYITGLLLGWWLLVKMVRQASLWKNPPFNGKAPAKPDDIGDLFVWTTLGVIVGGRLGYDLFYGIFFCGFWNGRDCGDLPWGYVHNPLRLIAEWNGWVPRLLGMSFHGGLIGVVVAIVLFCRNRKLSVLTIGDLVASVTPIGLFFGRIANFINGELWGKVTDAPWGMVFCNRTVIETYGRCPAGLSPRHPSQLYEAGLEGLVLFLALQLCIRRYQLHKRPGFITGLFFAGYGAARFFVEFFRDSESMIAGSSWFSMGMLLSIPMWAVAAFFIWAAYKRPQWA